MATPKEVEALAKESGDVKDLLLAARKFVLEHFPKAVEQVKPGWGVIWYGTGAKMTEQVVALQPRSTYVNLEFAMGTELPDPKGLLEGTGKRLRHVKIREPKDLKSPAVKSLVKAAVKSGPPTWPERAKRK